MDEIRSTGALRAWGWSLLAAGLLLLVIVWPLFTFGAITEVVADGMAGEDGGVSATMAVSRVAPWLGLAAIAASIALLVVASKRAAANREAAQRAVLRQP